MTRTAAGSLDALAERTPPLLALAVAVGAVSTSAVLVRWSSAPSAVIAFYRVLFTTLLLLPLVRTRYGVTFGRLGRRDGVVAAVTGIALAVHFAAWFESLRWTSVAASVTLVQAQPVFVALGAWLVLDERVGRRTAVGIAIAIAGMVLLSVASSTGDLIGGSRPLYGNALALLGAVAAAAYVLVGRSLRQRVPLLPYVTVVYGACTATLFVAVVGAALGGVGTGGWPGAADAVVVRLFDHPPRDWLLFLAMAVGPGLLGHTVINWALAHVRSAVVSVSLLGEPVGATLLGVVLLGEGVSPATLVGGAVVLAGVAVTSQARRADGEGPDTSDPDPEEPPDPTD